MKKKIIPYAICAVWAIACALVYGFFCPRSFFHAYAILAAGVPVCILFFSYRKETDRGPWARLLASCIIGLLFAVLSFDICFSINGSSGELLGEYDVKVQEVYGYKTGGTAGFINPRGEECSVSLHDYRVIWFDGDNTIEVGEYIRVQEYKGVFGDIYYVFLGEVVP